MASLKITSVWFHQTMIFGVIPIGTSFFETSIDRQMENNYFKKGEMVINAVRKDRIWRLGGKMPTRMHEKRKD